MYTAIERETIINLNDAERVAYIESYQRIWINRIIKAKNKAIENGHPEDVIIVRQTEDMIEAIVPRNYIKISPPRFISDERREQMRENAKRRNFGRKKDLPDDDTEEFLEDEDDEQEDEYEEDEEDEDGSEEE